MPTAFSGSLGWTGAHPVQLGGPPLVNTYDRKLPASARPFIAHVYQNDGVTLIGTLGVLNRPVLSPTLANGGFNQILLSISAFVASGMIWGQFIWGNQTWGGTGVNISQGNVIRLSEQGGDGSFIYGGIVEDLPETIGPSGVSHQILVSPFAVELDDTFSNSVYTAPVDVSQIVRDAFAQTLHCSCDQVSVPPSTGILAATAGTLDFRNQPVKQQIDTARSIAGPTWFWHVDELGRGWFQAMGSAAVYTIPMAQYEERTKSASIKDRKNKIVAVGGVPVGGSANIATVANGASQSTIGIRALNPALQVPNITDLATLISIAANILAVLDRTWQRVNLKVLPSYGRRIHASQPGGAMVRYWEPGINPMPESSAGSGYSGTFIAQSLSNDGLRQELTAGDIPVTSQTDVDNMVKSLVSRSAANSLQVTVAALNLQTQVQTGSFQSGTGTIGTASGTVPAGLWRLDPQMLQAFDASGQVRVQLGNLPAVGTSPAQWGLRDLDSSGNVIADSFGLFGSAKPLNFAAGAPGQSITGAGSGSFSTVTGSTFSITIPNLGGSGRSLNIMLWLFATADTAGGSGQLGYIRSNIVGFNNSANIEYDKAVVGLVSATLWFFPIGGIPPGTYSVRMEGAADVGQTLFVGQFFHQVWLAGSTG